ncbi:hypothetical protein DFJ73DRAFT_800773 [Zopfochytrium polystomum]|nr:hypothetical protein DFJ73DRAFT_800773 [Zopfochytrium polystomum]
MVNEPDPRIPVAEANEDLDLALEHGPPAFVTSLAGGLGQLDVYSWTTSWLNTAAVFLTSTETVANPRPSAPRAYKVLPHVLAFADDVRARLGATRIGTIGYCFGGQYAVLMGGSDKVDAFATAPRVERGGAKGPAGGDEARADVSGVQLKWFKGTAHGFALRGDEDDPVVRTARDDALASMLEFSRRRFEM